MMSDLLGSGAIFIVTILEAEKWDFLWGRGSAYPKGHAGPQRVIVRNEVTTFKPCKACFH